MALESASSAAHAALPREVLLLRAVVATVWIYEGLWLKIVTIAPHELAVVEAQPFLGPLSARSFMALVGAGETLLGVGVLSGLFPRFVAWFQAGLLLAMNALGILFGRGAIADPVGLVIHNLPLLGCIALLGLRAPKAAPAGPSREAAS